MISPSLCGKRKGKAAMVFSLDAMIALIMAMLAISAIFVILVRSTERSDDTSGIYLMSLDTLAVLEKSHLLSTAVETNSTTAILQHLQALPSPVCSNITIYDTENRMVLTTAPASCTDHDQTSRAIRAFVDANLTTYLAVMEAWYR